MNRELLKKLRGMRTLGVRTELESHAPDTQAWTAYFNGERNSILDIADETSDDFYEVCDGRERVIAGPKSYCREPWSNR